jgi:23S rRNA (cytosine1962-C5)-methyltransferase
MIRASGTVTDTYSLLYAGMSRRIERFGPYVIERPCPPCFAMSGAPSLDVDALFTAAAPSGHRWSGSNVPVDTWDVALDGLTFQLGLTDNGQVGLFPEQREQWRWIDERVRAAAGTTETSAPTVLNLFAYTGGSTLAAARAGANVVHVDASKAAVSWARRNAALSHFPEAPVRWIVDDAPAFLRRELRRGRRYDGIVVDPPTYGHGSKGQPWRLEHDLPPLLADCGALLAEQAGFLLVTTHTTGLDAEPLRGLVLDALWGPDDDSTIEAGALEIEPVHGEALRLGAFARLTR